jgi:predicted RNA polymerase sigma factor
VSGGEPGRAVEAVWRIESARLIAGLARLTGDVGLAEDLAQDALVAALERWLESGVPENPGAWLMATAKNRAIDLARRDRRFEDRREQLAREAGLRMAMDAAEHEAAASGLGDDLLAKLDRLLHRASVVHIDGESYRMRAHRETLKGLREGVAGGGEIP